MEKESYIKFLDENADGLGNDSEVFMKVKGNITPKIISEIEAAIHEYKDEIEADYYTKDATDVAINILKKYNCEAEYINLNTIVIKNNCW